MGRSNPVPSNSRHHNHVANKRKEPSPQGFLQSSSDRDAPLPWLGWHFWSRFKPDIRHPLTNETIATPALETSLQVEQKKTAFFLSTGLVPVRVQVSCVQVFFGYSAPTIPVRRGGRVVEGARLERV